MNSPQENTGSTQHRILDLLLANKEGLSIDSLAKALNVTRTAVQQHFVALERDGLIKKKQSNKTAGRPVNIYELTTLGINYFPKQYAWFSEIVLNNLLEEMGTDSFIAFMQKLGAKMAAPLKPRFADKALEENITELVNLMSGLGFQAQSSVDNKRKGYSIQAINCIYHDIAKKHPEVCEFDIALMSNLLNKDIKHSQCMAKGDCLCKFDIEEQPIHFSAKQVKVAQKLR